jgi:hypothetical protein
MEQLRSIGYLDYTEVKRGRVVYFCIHYRHPKLRPEKNTLNSLESIDSTGIVEPSEDKMVRLTREEQVLLERIRRGEFR